MADEKQVPIWHTSISSVEPGSIRIRGCEVGRLMAEASFADAVYLLLKGVFPPENHRRTMRALLVSSLDHGTTPPSVLVARSIVSGGNPLNAAVAGGILAIGESHGGAIEACAKLLQENASGENEIKRAAALVADYKKSKKRIPGYGHRLHGEDPRSAKLFQIAAEDNLRGRHIRFALALEKALAESSGKKLPINIDGAIAAVISEMGFDWRMGKGFFIISRTPGLVAHAFEERTREKPMRKMGLFDTHYDGPRDK